MWKKRIARCVYEIVLSSYCALLFVVYETRGERSRIYDPIALFLGWNREHPPTTWALVGLTALVFILFARLLGSCGPIRRLLWLATGLVVLAGYPLLWVNCRRGSWGLDHPEAVPWILLELISVIATYFASWRLRGQRIRKSLRMAAVVLHFGFWAWLDWSELGGLSIFTAYTYLLICGAFLGVTWVLEIGRE